MNLTHNENPWQQQQTHTRRRSTAQPTTATLQPKLNPQHQIHHGKPPQQQTPDPLRPRFTNHCPVAARSEGFIALDKRMRGNKCRCLIQTLNLLFK